MQGDYKKILISLSEGDEKAYTTVFSHYYDRLWPFVLKFTKSDQDAEEVLQEVFLRIWLYRDKMAEVENLDAWIFRVASRECLGFLRKRRPERKYAVCLSTDDDYANSNEVTPENRIHFEDVNRAICSAIEQMPARKREIYQMSRDKGMKPAEIARILSLSVGTVKNVLSQSLKDIRSYLARSGFEILLAAFSFSRFF